MDADSSLPDAWTTIAEKSRNTAGIDAIEWRELPGAEVHLTEVRKLVAKGLILMANRYSDDHVELVIRPVIRSSESSGR